MQKLLQPITELTNRLLAIQSSLSRFASHQLVTESTDLLSGAITVLPLASIPVSEDRPADPPGDHLVSRPITKFSGQPSLPALLVTVSQATENCCGRNCWLQRKQMGLVQQEKVVHTQQVFIVSGQGSAIIQMTMCACSTLQASGPGPRVGKM